MCNEFCGIGHHTMVGRVIVVDAPAVAITATSATTAAATGGAR
jgi:heme/copper-type cytochrome/quinol oxidase subunit 2